MSEGKERERERETRLIGAWSVSHLGDSAKVGLETTNIKEKTTVSFTHSLPVTAPSGQAPPPPPHAQHHEG